MLLGIVRGSALLFVTVSAELDRGVDEGERGSLRS